MSMLRRTIRLGYALGLASVFSGCAAISTYETCGVGGCPGDATVTRAIDELFTQHPALAAPNLIDVQTLNHVVYLYGLVDTELQRQLAESVARGTPGVSRVVNAIGVRNGVF